MFLINQLADRIHALEIANADLVLRVHELEASNNAKALRDISDQLTRMETRIMNTLDEVLADVTEEGSQIDSLSVLTAGLKQQLADALSGTTLPPAVQAKVDAVFAGVEQNKGKVIAALNANTPAADVPVT